MALLFIENVAASERTAFAKRVTAMAGRMGFNPNWLMAVINSETGGSFSPAQRNLAGSSATGLIQFMAATAAELGTSTAQLAAMTATAQLDYVERYLAMQLRNRKLTAIADYDDLYFLVFYPAAVGKLDSHVIFRSGTTGYAQNRGVDVDNNGQITVADFKAFIRKKISGADWNLMNQWEFAGKATRRAALFSFLAVCVVAILMATYALAKPRGTS